MNQPLRSAFCFHPTLASRAAPFTTRSCVLALLSACLFMGCSGNETPDPSSLPEGSGAANNQGSGGDNAGGTGAGAGSGTTDKGGEGKTFTIQEGKLLDRCGEEVVLRGVNEMIVWSPGKDGDPEFTEIAKTGANTVRIVWNQEGSAAELDVAIAGALAAKLIPMVENHDATGDLSLLPDAVDYWTQADVVEVLKKYEKELLLNIANESGDSDVTAIEYEAAYKTAITRIRDTGLVLPLVLDAPAWGQNIDVLQATWQALTAHDSEANLLFSVHMWWDDATGDRVKSELAESSAAGMPLVVGEFAQHAVYLCDQAPFAYGVLLDEAERLGIGWYAWSWGGVENNDCKMEGPFDMTNGGSFGDWTATWAEEVAVTHAASISNTSLIPHSIKNGACE